MAGTKLTTLLADFRAQVATMRELGVVSWNDIVLGPEPPPKPKDDKKKRDPHYERRVHYEELLGRKVSDADLRNLP